MNGVIKKLLLLVAGIFLLFFVNAITSVIFDRNDMPDSQITVSTKLNDVSQSEIESVKKETRKALNFIPPILGIDYKKKNQYQDC